MEQLNLDCELNNMLATDDSAYKYRHNCESVLLKIVNTLLWVMENRDVSALVMIDLSVAFKSIDHLLLLAVLKNKFGIDGTALNCFENFLQLKSFKAYIS